MAMAVHGDDFVVCGFDEDLRWAAEYIGSCFDVKVRAVLGEGGDDDKEVTVLGAWEDCAVVRLGACVRSG